MGKNDRSSFKKNSLPRKLPSADFLCGLTSSRHILLSDPVSVHNRVSKDASLIGQHPVGDVIEVKEVAEEVCNDAHTFGWAVGVAASGQQSSLESC